MKLSVIVPAHNEAAALPATLARIGASLRAACLDSEVLVVNNDSGDTTADVARACGATVIFEPTRNIAAVRNTGAREADGDVLVFVDADTIVPDSLVGTIMRVLEDQQCYGGSVAVKYDHLNRPWMKWYLTGWDFWAAAFNFAQGATQFVRRGVFMAMGGYDESIFMGEDMDFFWRLRRYAKHNGGCTMLVKEPRVLTSARRFNRMTLWKALLFTHPLFIRLTWRKRHLWRDWYTRVVR
jgi:glycosyltransferase involved in cell wall biosynthesis